MKVEYEEIGQVIRTERKKRNLTMVQLEKKCGWTNGYLSQIETGKIMPRMQVIVDVFDAMGMKIWIGVE